MRDARFAEDDAKAELATAPPTVALTATATTASAHPDFASAGLLLAAGDLRERPSWSIGLRTGPNDLPRRLLPLDSDERRHANAVVARHQPTFSD